ncbi:hypothetical protein [Kitasatospora sp. NPDC002040]|uniref:hypothetical protein n=1 Tax=Kitasatospora sp. NPDC002040 TaxID=3154661 RepID=UPI0033272A6D
MTTWQPRLLRTAVLAPLCVALTTAAHHACSGAELPLPALALAFAGTAVCTWLLATARPCIRLTGAWMTATQIALYAIFDRAAAHRPDRLLDLADPAVPAHGLSPTLALAHLLTALACTLLLWRGEAALRRAYRLLARLPAAGY